MRYLFSSLLLFFLFTTFSYAHAQSNVDLEASVGRFYFSASGIASPYASIVMTNQDIFLSSTVANKDGVFLLPAALVNDGFDTFCLEAIDVRRIGTSYTCFETDPPTGDYTKENLFLPPTIGLSGQEIAPNSPITASGYTMPRSEVYFNVSDDIVIEAFSDEDGYYDLQLNTGVPGGIPAGTYELYATAVLGVQVSAVPDRTFRVEVLSLFGFIPSWALMLALLLLILIFILLFILLWKRRRKRKDKTKTKTKKSSRLQRFFSLRS